MNQQFKEWSEKYKSSSSEDITRNPTTNKKNILQTKHRSLQVSIKIIKQRRQHLTQNLKKLLGMKQYKPAIKLERKIQGLLKSQQNLAKILLKKDHKRQLNIITGAHKEQMNYFYETWDRILKKYQQKQESLITNFKVQQQQQCSKAQEDLNKRINKIKIVNKSILNLNLQQKQLIKYNRIADLVKIQSQKIHFKKQLKNQRNYLIKSILKAEERRLSQNGRKKYNSLKMKLQENQNVYQKIYYNNESRLIKKYGNVMTHLKHQHSLQRNLLQKSYREKSNRSWSLLSVKM